MILEQERAGAVSAEFDSTPSQFAFGMEQVILDVIRGIVADVDWPGKNSQFTGSAGIAHPAKALMEALIYAMATGAVDPRDFKHASLEDLNSLRLGEGLQPDPETLREFAHRYRPGLERCLAKLFERTVLVRFGDDFDESFLADTCVALAWDCWFESLHVPARFCWQNQHAAN